MPPQPMLLRRHCFWLVCPGFCPVPLVHLLLCKNTERISMKLAGANHCRAINRLNNYVLGKIATGIREHETTKYSNRRQTGADA